MDFEFTAHPGERQIPSVWSLASCGAAVQFVSCKTNSGQHRHFLSGPDALFVALLASAELGCFRALGWSMPARILDLYVEFRDRTSGLERPHGSSLLGVLTYFGIDGIGAVEKKEMQALAMRKALA